MTYVPKRLSKWTLPECYVGAAWPEHYVFLGQHRDSDVLARSNFTCALEALGGESETVRVVREGHWAVGWVEWIAIHESDAEALRKADAIQADLADYPILNEDHFSEMEWDEVRAYWEGMSVRDRAYWCQKAGLSIFAARRSEFPQDPYGNLFDMLRT